jgi:glyoxylase-like metal-dependent hydrolase (beta-lactamase superfamily II)
MNRRSLLKKSIASGVVSLLPLSGLLAKGQKIESVTNDYKPNGFRQIQLGDLELTILTDGYIKQSPVHPFVAPLATAEAVKKLLEENFRPTDYIELGLNVMVVKSKDKLVLLDTGMGIFAQPTQGQLMKSLASAGFKASNFTDIILSHAHTDHIGGLVDKKNNLVFPNAAIHISKIEHDFWQKATIEDFKNSPLYNMQDFVKQTISQIQNVLKVIQPKLNFIDLQKGLHNIFYFELAPGHTPGLTMTTIKSKDEKLIFIADLIHSDALLFTHPEWGFIGDTNIQEAVTSRIRMLQYLTDNKIKTFAFHLPYPGFGHVRKKETAFEWIPEVFATP